jgi:hypothetical protein
VEAHIHEQERHSAAAQQAQNARVVATFAKRAKEVAITDGATPNIAEATSMVAGAEAGTALANAMAMQD